MLLHTPPIARASKYVDRISVLLPPHRRKQGFILPVSVADTTIDPASEQLAATQLRILIRITGHIEGDNFEQFKQAFDDLVQFRKGTSPTFSINDEISTVLTWLSVMFVPCHVKYARFLVDAQMNRYKQGMQLKRNIDAWYNWLTRIKNDDIVNHVIQSGFDVNVVESVNKVTMLYNRIMYYSSVSVRMLLFNGAWERHRIREKSPLQIARDKDHFELNMIEHFRTVMIMVHHEKSIRRKQSVWLNTDCLRILKSFLYM